MISLEKFLTPTQKELYALVRKMYKGRTICCKKSFVLVYGEAPVMLVAHMDTVHNERVKHICTTQDGNILMSPQGIGGDDRCGVYALVNAYEAAEKKPWLLFTCDEEIGGRGADNFCRKYKDGKLPKELADLKLIIEIDRRGSEDAVYYSCDNKEFEDYITSKGFKTASGSFSDISYIAPDLGVAAVNLSSGYYNAHTQHEYINRQHIDAVIAKVNEIVAEAAKPDFPKYEYIEKKVELVRRVFPYASPSNWWKHDKDDDDGVVTLHTNIPKDLPVKYKTMYDELLDYYEMTDLEVYREMYGNEVIEEMYRNEIWPQYNDGWGDLK